MSCRSSSTGVGASDRSHPMPGSVSPIPRARISRPPDCESVEPYLRIIGDDYLQAMGVRLLSGRAIEPGDDHTAPLVALVNDRLADLLWPGAESHRRDDHDRRDTIHRSSASHRGCATSRPTNNRSLSSFSPARQNGDYRALNLIARGPVSASLVQSIRAAVRAAAPNLAMDPPRRIQGLVDSAISSRRFLMVLVSIFAGTALLLASLGIYGVHVLHGKPKAPGDGNPPGPWSAPCVTPDERPGRPRAARPL